MGNGVARGGALFVVALKKPSIALIFLCLAVAGCGGQALRWEHETHVVRAGETLQTIAFRYGLDTTDLAAWNSIDNPDLIFAGQTLRLKKPSGSRQNASRNTGSTGRGQGKPASPAGAKSRELSPAWRWPTTGQLAARFGDATTGGQGIDILGQKGIDITAAASGVVVYSGSGLLGYGKLIILKHNDTYLSAYGHNDVLLVREGDSVSAGQKIGAMGIGPGDRALLHFEIRRRGRPVDPLLHLPPR